MNIQPYKRTAQFYETDQMGVIHHSNYIRWFEEARVDFMNQIGYSYSRATESGIDFALLGLSCEYKSMVRFGDLVEIQMSITAMTPTRMTINYLLINTRSGNICSIGETRHCFYSGKKQLPVSLKREMPELFELMSGLISESEG